MNCVSFSLFGTQPHYWRGGVRNAELAAELFPKWECLFHVGEEIPRHITDRIEASGAQVIIKKPKEEDCWGYYWRFYRSRNLR